MKKIKKEKLSIQKVTITELDTAQMNRVNGGSEYNTGADPDTTATIDTDTKLSGPRLTYTTCSSIRSH